MGRGKRREGVSYRSAGSKSHLWCRQSLIVGACGGSDHDQIRSLNNQIGRDGTIEGLNVSLGYTTVTTYIRIRESTPSMDYPHLGWIFCGYPAKIQVDGIWTVDESRTLFLPSPQYKSPLRCGPRLLYFFTHKIILGVIAWRPLRRYFKR
jgi:hypothetical protein